MRALQSALSFPRLKYKKLKVEHEKRKSVVTSIQLIYNLRALIVGIYQIRTVYLNNINNSNDEVAPHVNKSINELKVKTFTVNFTAINAI
jgi:hypothetical protein